MNIKQTLTLHDEIPAFHAGYLLITLVFAALLNVGAIALLIAAHMGLDLVKYHEIHHQSWKKTWIHTLRESLLDVFMLAVALCFGLYLHHSAGVLAFSGVVRMEEVLLRGAGMVIPRMEVMWNALWIFSNVRQHVLSLRPYEGPWRNREVCYLVGLILSVALLLASPLFIDHSTLLTLLREQLVPWKI